MIPAPVLDALPPGPHVVEIGVGSRFEAARALLERFPEAHLVLTDVDPDALEGAPEAANATVDDVTSPRLPLYRGADLIYARRCPAELQPPIARLAANVGAVVALHALKDEWAHLPGELGEVRTVSDGEDAWRVVGLEV